MYLCPMINVLSVFDGISCGRVALERCDIEVSKYYASEVDKFAIKVSYDNYPDIVRLGDIRNVNVADIDKIDLYIGGSPCQSFSFAGKMKGMVTFDNIEITTLEQYLNLKESGFEFQGQSYLFWEYVRILKDIQVINPDVKFLLENVYMIKKWEKIITDTLGVQPHRINSNKYSAQNRRRLYWTNIDGVKDKETDDLGLTLADIMLPDDFNDFTYATQARIDYLQRRTEKRQD
jgi:site-specific DNA-cytosine methylase